MNDNDQMIAEIARLKDRVENLEKSSYSEQTYVEGWASAAKLLGVNERTCMNRYASGEFPTPRRLAPYTRGDGRTFSKPTWRRSDLEDYAEGRWVAK